jgi:hypothetical protein
MSVGSPKPLPVASTSNTRNAGRSSNSPSRECVQRCEREARQCWVRPQFETRRGDVQHLVIESVALAPNNNILQCTRGGRANSIEHMGQRAQVDEARPWLIQSTLSFRRWAEQTLNQRGPPPCSLAKRRSLANCARSRNLQSCVKIIRKCSHFAFRHGWPRGSELALHTHPVWHIPVEQAASFMRMLCCGGRG